MENKEIRKRILEILYAEDEERPASFINRDFLKEKIGIPDNKLDSNVLYLEEKGYIELLKVMGSIFLSAKITSYGKDLVENKEEFNSMFSVTIKQQIIDKSPGGLIIEKSKTGDIHSHTINGSPEAKQVNLYGDGAKVDISENKQFNIPTDNLLDNLILFLGDKILSFDKPMRYITLLIPSLISIYLTIDFFVLKMVLPFLAMAIPIIWVGILLSLFKAYRNRTCEECRRKFAYEEFKPSRVVATGEYMDSKIYNIKKFYKCRFCNYETEKEVIDKY